MSNEQEINNVQYMYVHTVRYMAMWFQKKTQNIAADAGRELTSEDHGGCST